MSGADGWVLIRTESGWTLFHPLTGVQIEPNSQGARHWIQRTTPEDRRLLYSGNYDHCADSLELTVTDCTCERDAETGVLLMGRALGAQVLTQASGAWVEDPYLVQGVEYSLAALLAEPEGVMVRHE